MADVDGLSRHESTSCKGRPFETRSLHNTTCWSVTVMGEQQGEEKAESAGHCRPCVPTPDVDREARDAAIQQRRR